MPYDNQNDFNVDIGSFDGSFDDNDYLIENFSENAPGERQDFDDVSVFNELSRGESDGSDVNNIDYSVYLEDIISNQETIIANQETIISLNTEIQNNGYRLYYFVGGLYVAFAIIIMVKFFKTFLF